MKITLFTITTLLLLFNCSNNAPNEPPIPCNDGICLTNEQLNFFKMHLEDDTLTKKVLFEMSSMDLSSKDITSLDTGIFDNLTNLTSVDLTDNLICIVDKSNVGLTDRVNLNFEIGQCLTDDQLTFFRSHISSLDTKKKLYEATNLNLSSKSITSLDTGIFNNLTSLTSVDLTDNDICSVDKGDVGLTDRVNLNFEIGQCLTDEQVTFFSTLLPSSITTKQELYEAPTLDLSSKSIASLEAGIFNNLTNLKNLWLNNNALTSIPTEIGNLTYLTTLSLFNNQLASIPAEIGNLTSLTILRLNNNALTDIPTEIGNLTNLTGLSLFNNQLASIPAEIGNLTSLTDLRLYSNDLTNIPAEIGNLTNLTKLFLYNNQLTSIPNMLFTSITSLTFLQLKYSTSSDEMNSFDCDDTNYTAWGLTDPTTTITNFLCS